MFFNINHFSISRPREDHSVHRWSLLCEKVVAKQEVLQPWGLQIVHSIQRPVLLTGVEKWGLWSHQQVPRLVSLQPSACLSAVLCLTQVPSLAAEGLDAKRTGHGASPGSLQNLSPQACGQTCILAAAPGT